MNFYLKFRYGRRYFYGGDAGGNPPHPGGLRLPGSCQTGMFLVF